MSEADVRVSARKQHARLEVLVDSVYALVIVLLVAGLPTPRDVGWSGGSPLEFFLAYGDDTGVAALGLFLVVGYWLQNNAMFGSLTHTDDRFATLSIVQILLLLVYLYATNLGVDFEQHELTLALQSGSLLLMGVTSLLAWRYARRDRRLIRADVTDEELAGVQQRLLPEPLTAALTLAVAPFGADAWGLAWLAFPILSFWIGRRERPSRR